MTSQWNKILSSIAVVRASSPKISTHSVGALFVVMIIEVFSCRALIRLKKATASSLFQRHEGYLVNAYYLTT